MNQSPRHQPAWYAVVAAVSPIGILIVLWAGVIVSMAGSSLSGACVVIGSCLVLLLIAGRWIVQVSGMPSAVKAAMWATAGVACVGWGLQRLAYVLFVPTGFLTYGYFLTEPGSTARFYMMSGPLELGGLAFATALVVAARKALTGGARWWVVTLVLWWLVAYIVFAIPSFNLWAQGDAAVFI